MLRRLALVPFIAAVLLLLALLPSTALIAEPELVNGMCVYEIVGGKLREIHPLVTETDLRMEESL